MGARLTIAIFSVFYFVDIVTRASAKYFWFDELSTIYICRLGSFAEVQQAVLHGVDYNPPLFYILTRLTGGPFGYGLISTRIPEILAFWALCVCLYFLVAKRLGNSAGIVAMLLPLLTTARFYAYDARPHGIVLGCGAVAALAWQRAADSRRRIVWVAVIFVALSIAFLCHAYALALCFPLGVAELYRNWRRRRIGWPIYGAMAAAVAVAAPFIIPLVRSYRAFLTGAGINVSRPPKYSAVPDFYQFLLEPTILLLVGLLTIVAIASLYVRREPQVFADGGEDSVLALGFLGLPLFAVVAAFLTHGPFIPRYSISAVIGLSLIAGFAAGLIRGSRWASAGVVALLAVFVLFDSAHLVGHRMSGRGEVLAEPSTSMMMATTPGNPMDAHGVLLANEQKDLPIAVLSGLEYAYVFEYSPPEMRRRLWYVPPDDTDAQGLLITAARDWCHLEYHFSRKQDFVRANPRFLLYGRPQIFISSFALAPSMQVQWVKVEDNSSYDAHFLSEVQVNQ